MPRDLDLASYHMAYCHASLIDLYLRVEVHSNQRNFVDGRRTDVRTYGMDGRTDTEAGFIKSTHSEETT